MAQVYAVCYTSAGRVLVARKRFRGFFFKPSIIQGGQVFRTNQGAGKSCFPGGGLNGGESARDGALREFREETGIDLTTVAVDKEYTRPFRGFSIGYWELAEDSFTRLAEAVRNNLAEASSAAIGVHDGALRSWAEVKAKFPNCPESNELQDSFVMNLADANDVLSVFDWWEDDNCGWFYEALKAIFPKIPSP